MPQARVWPWLLALALVAAQALGLMHRVVHAPQLDAAHALIAHPSLGHSGPHEEGTWVKALFAGHDDDSTCRLFDPLNHEGAPTVSAVTLPLVLASFFLQWFQGEALVRWAALFDARGPPSFR